MEGKGRGGSTFALTHSPLGLDLRKTSVECGRELAPAGLQKSLKVGFQVIGRRGALLGRFIHAIFCKTRSPKWDELTSKLERGR